MWDIVYYLAGVGMIGTIGYGVLWIYDRDMAEDVAQQVSWNSVKAYHKANLEYNNLKRWYEVNTRERLDRSDDEADAELDEIVQKDIEFLGYNESDDTTFTSDEIEDNEYILSKCEELWPELDRTKIVGTAVGLRPSRHEIRLEEESIKDKKIIHNYGHGGAGVTLSWGCADEVVKLLKINMLT